LSVVLWALLPELKRMNEGMNSRVGLGQNKNDLNKSGLVPTTLGVSLFCSSDRPACANLERLRR